MGKKLAEAENVSFRQMDYEEFKEALLRCGIYKWDDQSVKHCNKPLTWKLESILASVVKLDPLDQIAERKKMQDLVLLMNNDFRHVEFLGFIPIIVVPLRIFWWISINM